MFVDATTCISNAQRSKGVVRSFIVFSRTIAPDAALPRQNDDKEERKRLIVARESGPQGPPESDFRDYDDWRMTHRLIARVSPGTYMS